VLKLQTQFFGSAPLHDLVDRSRFEANVDSCTIISISMQNLRNLCGKYVELEDRILGLVDEDVDCVV
jgi:hypothetical protein